MRSTAYRRFVLALALLLLLSSTAFAATSVTTLTDLSDSPISSTAPTKQQVGPYLFYSNEPETLSVGAGGTKPIWNDGWATDLAWLGNVALNPTGSTKWRVFAAHTVYHSSAINMGVMIKTTGSGTVKIIRKGTSHAGPWTQWSQVGLTAAAQFLEDTTVRQPVNVGNQWQLLDTPVPVYDGEHVNLLYEIEITPTTPGTWSMAVTAGVAPIDFVSRWRNGQVHDAVATCAGTEVARTRGAFLGYKDVATTLDFTGKSKDFAYRDQIGHYSQSQSDPVSDLGEIINGQPPNGLTKDGLTADGWMRIAPGGYSQCNSFLGGNYGVQYHQRLTIKGSSGKIVKIYAGPGIHSDNIDSSWGIAARVNYGTVYKLGPVACTGITCQWTAWNFHTVTIPSSGQITVDLDFIVVTAVNLPYHVWYRLEN